MGEAGEGEERGLRQEAGSWRGSDDTDPFDGMSTFRLSENFHVNCVGCEKSLLKGEEVTIILIGPGDDVEARKKAALGQAYNAIGRTAHVLCVDPSFLKEQP
jgi:hypothetical protein